MLRLAASTEPAIVKMSKVADGPDVRVPWVGEHTDEVLRADLGLDDGELARLRDEGVIG